MRLGDGQGQGPQERWDDGDMEVAFQFRRGSQLGNP